MAGELILITGGTGHIGFRTLVEALRAGYRVRAAVRRESTIDSIKNAASVKPYVDNLEFAIVKDITADGAFDEAIVDAVYVLHIASPLAIGTDNFQRDIIEPALHGTLSILNSALKVPTLKRIVITSSSAVIGPRDPANPPEIYTEKDIAPIPQGPFNNSFEAYSASKSLAHEAADKFIAEHKLHFSLVRILPSFVIGRHELATTVESFMSGTNKMVFPPLLGQTFPFPLGGVSVHVDDVARGHVDALNTEKIKDNETFLMSSDGVNGIVWEDSIEIVKREFPEAVKKGVFPFGGSLPTRHTKMDAGKVERVMGWPLKTFEEQVKSAVTQYLELIGEVAA